MGLIIPSFRNFTQRSVVKYPESPATAAKERSGSRRWWATVDTVFRVATSETTTRGMNHAAVKECLIAKRRLFISFLVIFLTITLPLSAQQATVAFYNVENLFDTQGDSLKQDEEFLPYGVRGWTYKRLQTKYRHVYKVIVGLDPAWQPPALIALAEVENRAVLKGLLRHTPLHRKHYQIIHEESPDTRGIDVALLYDPAQFQYLNHHAIPVDLRPLSDRPTRDILYVRGLLFGSDTIHYFINHWPSRYSGVTSSAPLRQRAATVLRERIRSLQGAQPNALIVITGDFNDNPTDASVRGLGEANGAAHLTNISQYESSGTHKFQGEWNTFDQFIVSQNLLDPESLVQVEEHRAHVYNPAWLLEEDKAHLGYRPRRTYVGYQYHGGVSDHLPVYLQLRKKSAEVAGK